MTTETVPNCPACENASRTLAHAQVPDFVFGATDERWDIARCSRCGTLYLPTRPDAASIGRYYERYYTHVTAPDSAPISGIAVESSLLKRLANSWRNARHGTQRASLGPIGALVISVVWPLRQWLNAECRHLPPASRRAPGFRVLDVGFGDGRFLRFAAEAGCRAAGMEIDPKAVSAARQGGLDVYAGDIDAALQQFGQAAFDHITMSHVIEHVHSPRHTLEVAARLLKNGGTLWVETPNPQSSGHERFGPRWRDLDPPRHLCLMSRDAIVELAARCGLRLAAEHHRPFVPFEVFPFSAAAAGAAGRPWKLRMQCLAAELAASFRPRQREWLTMSFTYTGDKH